MAAHGTTPPIGPRTRTPRAAIEGAIVPLSDLSQHAVNIRRHQLLRTSYNLKRIATLQELCQRTLVKHLTLAGFKYLTETFNKIPFRRRMCTMLSDVFSGCYVDFCLEWTLMKHGSPAYRVRCISDQNRYLAIRLPEHKPETLYSSDDLWYKVFLSHNHLLNVYAIAVDLPIKALFAVTTLPDDTLDHFMTLLSTKALCIDEYFAWKFTREVTDALIYLRTQNVFPDFFDSINLYISRASILLNNPLTWKRRTNSIATIPNQTLVNIFGTEIEFRQRFAVLTKQKPFCATYSVAYILTEMINLAQNAAIPTLAKTSQGGGGSSSSKREIHALNGIELKNAPYTYVYGMETLASQIFSTTTDNRDTTVTSINNHQQEINPPLEMVLDRATATLKMIRLERDGSNY